jgi:hypothetical protein
MTKDVQKSLPGAPDGPTPSAWRLALRRGLSLWGVRVLLGLASLLAAACWANGVYSTALLMWAVPGTGIFLLALGAAGLLRWRTGWRWRAACLAGWVGALGVLVLIYVFAWQPLQRLKSGAGWYDNADPAEVRSVCHRMLVWVPDVWGVAVPIGRAGDETSVPYILWAMRRTDGEHHCGYAHAVDALQMITNNSPGQTPEAWNEWYAKNARRSQMAWWAAGFAAEGYKVSPYEGTEAPKAARELLAVLGRSTWLERPLKWYLTFNATRMLEKLPPADVRKAMGEVVKGESPAEKRGLARYTRHLTRSEGGPILKALSADSDRSVRLAATGQWCENRTWHWSGTSDEPFFRPCKPGEAPDLSGPDADTAPASRPAQPGPSTRATQPTTLPSAEEAAPLAPRMGKTATVGQPCELPEAIRGRITPPTGVIAAGVHGAIAWMIRTDGSGDLYVLHLEGWSLQTARKVYARQLVNTDSKVIPDSVAWLFDAPTGRLFVSNRDYTGAIDVRSGAVLWEIGCGGGDQEGLQLLGRYLVVNIYPPILMDASEGQIVAFWPLPQTSDFDDLGRLRLFRNQVWASDRGGRWYILDFSNTHTPWSEPADQEPAEEATRRDE